MQGTCGQRSDPIPRDPDCHSSSNIGSSVIRRRAELTALAIAAAAAAGGPASLGPGLLHLGSWLGIAGLGYHSAGQAGVTARGKSALLARVLPVATLRLLGTRPHNLSHTQPRCIAALSSASLCLSSFGAHPLSLPLAPFRDPAAAGRLGDAPGNAQPDPSHVRGRRAGHGGRGAGACTRLRPRGRLHRQRARHLRRQPALL